MSAVTYSRVNFTNRVVEHPRTYAVTENQDGTITLTPQPGEVVSEGTPLNSTNLNKMDKGVKDCADAINDMNAQLSDDEEDIADLKGRKKTFTATIPATGWISQGSGAYFTLSLPVTGIQSTDTPDIGIVQTGTWATDEAIREAWALITRITAGTNTLNITAEAVPSVQIPLQVRCFR